MKYNEKFLITYWNGIPQVYLKTPDGKIDLRRIEEMKEAGFNHICASYDPKENLMVLDVAHDLGLKVTVEDGRIYEAIRNESMRRELLENVVSDYKDHPAMFGYHIFDEPHPDMFETLADIRKIMTELDPVHESYINLFPNYGFPVPVADIPYDEYVDKFMKTVEPEILSYDNYHYIDGEKLDHPSIDNEAEANVAIATAYQKKVDREGFIDNLEIIRAKGLEYDTPYMSIILVVEHGPYRYVTESEIRFDAFQSLAYGCSRLCYFTYWTPGLNGGADDAFWKWKEGMITKDGKKTEHYYMVQRINSELIKMGNELVDKKSTGVFFTNTAPEKLTHLFEGYGCVESIEGDDVTIGFFEGNYAVIANRNTESESEISLHTDSMLEYFDTEESEWVAIENINGTYMIGLDAGDAMLVRFIGKIKY